MKKTKNKSTKRLAAASRASSRRTASPVRPEGKPPARSSHAMSRELQDLTRLAQQMSSGLSRHDLGAIVLSEIKRFVKPDVVLFYVLEGETMKLQQASPLTKQCARVGTRVSHVGECLCGHAAQGNPVYSKRLATDRRCELAECKEAGVKSLAALPLISSRGVIGVISLASLKIRDFSLQADYLEALAALVAAALDNSVTQEESAYKAEALKRLLHERRQSEHLLLQSTRMTETLNRISKAFLFTGNEEEMYEEVLRIVLEVMESPYGVFGYINDQGDLVCPSMTRHIWSQCQMSHKTIVFPESTWGNSIWGRVLRTGETLYANRRLSVPEGHVPIDRCITSPLIFQGRAIGHFVAANRPHDYTDNDVITLRRIGEYVAPVLWARLEHQRSERALRESDERLRQAVRVSNIGIFEHDHLKNTIYWSPRMRLMYGWDPDAPIGLQQFLGLIHPEDMDRIAVAVSRAHDPAGDGIFDVEHRAVHRDGAVRWLTTRSQTFFEGEGDTRRPVLTVGAVLDITERRNAEEALRESEERFRSIFNGALDGIILVDAVNRKCAMGNRTVLAMLGYTEDELKTLRPDDIHPDDAMPRVIKHLEETMRGDISVVEEMPVKRKDGTLYYADISATIVTLDGRPHFLGVFRDVTERRRASEEQQKLVSIIETSEDFIGIADLDGRALYVNAAGQKLVGLDGIGSVRNRPVAEFHQEADRGKFESEVLSSIRERGHWRGEVAFRHFKTGELIPVEMYGFVIKDSRTGQPIALATISRDITDRKHAEEERRKLQTQLLQSQKMESIGQLAGGIAHDFNNILAAIVGYGNLLQMHMRDDDPARVQVDQILASAERAASLTQSLLAFSRKQVINPKNIDLNASIHKVERLLSRIIGEDIMLKTSLSADALTVYADPTQIEQVLMNLATNARDAMPKGGTLIIRTEWVVFDNRMIKAQGYGTPGTFAAMSVIDTGSGMDEQTKEKIFDPFFTTKELGRGTGLGLSIVYGIVKQNKGDINVASEVGKGTTITIFLPLVSAGLQEGQRPETVEPIRGGTETILLAEDNEDVRSLTKQVLTDFGYTVVESGDGEEALDKFLQVKDVVQLLVLDVILPKKNGREVYETASRLRPGIKALFTSGYPADLIQKEGVIEKGLNFIPKPATPRVLLQKIREVLDQ